MGFRRGALFLLGDPEGLAGRSRGEARMRPAPSTPGIDLVRDMVGGARLAADLDLTWPERGDVVLGRYGSDKAEGGAQFGEHGGGGSVDRRTVEGLPRFRSKSVDCSRKVGTCREDERGPGAGGERNSWRLSVSGTDSIVYVFSSSHYRS